MEYLYIFIAAFSWSISPIFDKLALRNTNISIMLASRMLLSSIVLYFVLFSQGKIKNIFYISKYSFIMILISAILSGVIGYLCYFKALSIGNVSKVVPLVATYPFFSCLISIFFLGESFSFFKILGSLLIIAGVVVINLK